MIRAVHPVLMAPDLGAALAFYQRLGFQLVFLDASPEPRYAALARDGVEVHLQWAEAPAGPGDRPVVRFLVEDVDRLYEELAAAGALAEASGPFAAPRDSAWGTRELHLRDPGRNGLQFYAPLVRDAPRGAR
jgi:catechol 2,3-dioxygenase-like lactoylglutathione lyase family enzyme